MSSRGGSLSIGSGGAPPLIAPDADTHAPQPAVPALAARALLQLLPSLAPPPPGNASPITEASHRDTHSPLSPGHHPRGGDLPNGDHPRRHSNGVGPARESPTSSRPATAAATQSPRGDRASKVVWPPTHVRAHVPFLHCCREWPLDRGARDWNEEFQTLWAELLDVQIRGPGYHERIKIFLLEFEEYSQGLVNLLFSDGNWRANLSDHGLSGGGPASGPENGARGTPSTGGSMGGQQFASHGCTRHGNVVLRVWRDQRLALNAQRSFRAFLEARTPYLFCPLTATFRHLNVCVSVQALIPLHAHSATSAAAGPAAPLQYPHSFPVVYRADDGSDTEAHLPVHQFLSFAAAALNLLPPGFSADGSAAPVADGSVLDSSQSASHSGAAERSSVALHKMAGVEVVAALDERLYVMNALGLLTPITQIEHRAVPVRRWLHAIRGPPLAAGQIASPPELYSGGIASAHLLLAPALNEAEPRRGECLVELLHGGGLNVCFLGLIAGSLYNTPKEAVSTHHEPLLRLIATEVLARAVRRVMFHQMAFDRYPCTLRAVGAYLTRTVASLLDPTPERFIDGLMPHVKEMFLLGGSTEYVELAKPLAAALRDGVVPVVQRLCQLVSLQMLRGTVSAILSPPSKHNFLSLFDAHHEALIAALVANDDEVVYPHLLDLCFVRPHRVDFLSRTGRSRACLAVLQETVREAGRTFTDSTFLAAHSWLTTAVVSAACGERADALMLCERACDTMDETPALVASGASPAADHAPTHSHFLRGRVKARIVLGHVRTLLGDLAAAGEAFEHSLRLSAGIGYENIEYASQLRLVAVVGLFELARSSEGVGVVVRTDQFWESERLSLPSTRLGAHISDMFGLLLLERGAFDRAAERLWECLSTTRRLQGWRAYVLAEVLNKLAFVYYTWDVELHGLYSSCLLRQAEDITVERCGVFSPQHICVMENIVALMIQRGRYIEASKLLHTLKTLPPRYALRVPRDHPVTIRLPEIQAKLLAEFKPFAVDLIERYWIAYRNKLMVQAVCETSAKEIQRVGRAFKERAEMGRLHSLAVRCVLTEPMRLRTIEAIRLQQHIPVILSFSKPLINGSALFSKNCRNCNAHYQYVRIFYMWWDMVEGAQQQSLLEAIEADFAVAARAGAEAARADRTLAQPVMDCSTSFVVDNIVYTRFARGSQLPHLQNQLFASIRRVPQQLATATLSAIIDDPGSGDVELYAEALIPLGRRPRFTVMSDGREGPRSTYSTRLSTALIVGRFRAAGLTSDGADATHFQGLEMVCGMDEQHYVTNALGLVFSVIQGQVTEWALPTGRLSEAGQGCRAGKAREMTEWLEQQLIAADASHPILNAYSCLLLACVRCSAGLDKPTTHKYFQTASEGLEEEGVYLDAIMANYNEARSQIRSDTCKLAIPPLLRIFHLITDRARLRPYFGCIYALVAGRWLLVASQAAGKPFDASVLPTLLVALERGEPSPVLFTTCEDFIGYYRKAGDGETLDGLLQIRLRRAQALPPEERERYILQLKRDGEDAFRRGGNESYRECGILLLTAIQLAEAKHDEGITLASVLNLYGALQMTLNNLKQAQKSLSRAHRIIVKNGLQNSPEAFAWRKNNRTLKSRLHDNAIRVLRRAVRQWKERRRLNRELQRTDPAEYAKLLEVQLTRRINRLKVAEATRRVHVTEEETEEWYAMGKRQRRGRGEAMLRRTHGARVQLFVDKLASALADLAELAFAAKAAIEGIYWATHIPLQTQSLLTAHRLGRRVVIRDWLADSAGLKLWHVEHVDAVIRAEFAKAYDQYLLRCVSAEERAWRRIIAKQQKNTKKHIGRFIKKTLRSAKPKTAVADQRALVHQEERAREDMYLDEDREFAVIDDDWVYGIEVVAEYSGSLNEV